MPDVNTQLTELGQAWEEFKATQIKRIDALEAGKGTAEIDQKLAKIEAVIDAAQKRADEIAREKKTLSDRVDQLEAARESLGGAKFSAQDAAKRKHLDAFQNWLRNGKSHAARERLMAAEAEAVQLKAANISTTGAAGGYSIPEILVAEVFNQAQLLSPVRARCKVIQSANTDIRLVVNKHGASTGWVAESSSRSATTTPDLRERVPTFGTLYSYVSATEESLNDIGFDVASWLSGELAVEFAKAEGIAFLTGNGSAKPTGMLNTTPVTTNDGASPERAAGVLEYVPLDPSASPSTSIQATALIDLIYTLRSEYRANAIFAANSATIGRLRKLRDSYGQFLWSPSFVAGQPATLCGYPIEAWEDLADVALNANSVLFGDFSRGYVIVDVQGMRTTVDDNITVPGYVKWYFRRRLGGCILDNYAIKVGRIAAA